MSGFGFYAVLVFSGLCVGLAKGGFGGAGMVAVVAMAAIFPPIESTGAILPMLITGDILAVWLYRAHARASFVLKLLPPALAGIVAGWALMPHVPAAQFGKLMGWILVGLMAMVVVRQVKPALLDFPAEKRRFAWPLGLLAGATTMVSNAAGPVMTLYLLACRLPKMEFVATAAWFFFAVNVAKIPFSLSLGLISPRSLALDALAAPAVIAGVFAGRWILARLGQKAFDWIMIAFSLLGAIRMIAQ